MSDQMSKDYVRGVDYIGVNCVFFCHDGKGNVLMHKRSQNCRDEKGTWDAGGGAMEFGETFEECVRREMMEEYCIEPITIEYVTTVNVLRENEGKKTHWIKNIHWILVDPTQAKIGEPRKMDEIGWFSLESPPAPPHSQWHTDVAALKKYLKTE